MCLTSEGLLSFWQLPSYVQQWQLPTILHCLPLECMRRSFSSLVGHCAAVSPGVNAIAAYNLLCADVSLSLCAVCGRQLPVKEAAGRKLPAGSAAELQMREVPRAYGIRSELRGGQPEQQTRSPQELDLGRGQALHSLGREKLEYPAPHRRLSEAPSAFSMACRPCECNC